VGSAWRLLACLLGAALLGAACRSAPDDPAALAWYVNPDNGGQARLAARCSAASGGRYHLQVHPLPRDATGQREQLVRRLAARDPSIDLLNVDPPFLPELATAGFLRPFTADEARALAGGSLAAPLRAATWEGTLFAVPLWASPQLLWYRRSVARRAGLELEAGPVTWSQLIDAAERTGTTVEVQGRRYEGYMVWINALVASAGGEVLRQTPAGEARPGLDSPAGRAAAEVIRRLARSPAADPALATADEELGRAAFQGPRGGFMVNWPYVWGAAQEAVATGALAPAVLDDVGWARYPRVRADLPSRPPIGGIGLAVSAFSRRAALALEAARCLSSPESQTAYMLDAKIPVAHRAAYDDRRIRERYPMAALIRSSLDEAEPRPRTPSYVDVSAATVRTFHPPAAVEPDRTPAEADRLIVAVLHDRVLL
jgi:multiple sugar transport system substrate-binding protein